MENKKTVKILSKTDSIKRTMDKIMAGEYSIPRFQRDFVWPAKKIVKLAESISKGFPIGVLTTWESNGEYLKGRNEVINALCKAGIKSDTELVIDGQQRITSIAIIYFAPDLIEKIDSGNSAISKETGKSLKSTLSGITFYEDQFLIKTELVKKFIELGDSESAARNKASGHSISIVDVNAKVRKLLDRYDINIQKITNADVSSIIKIFTVMNSDVKALTHIDLMNGSIFNVTTNESFDLIDFIKKSNGKWKNFGKIKQELFVILMKIFSDLHLERKDNTHYKSDALVKWSNNGTIVNEFIQRKTEFLDLLRDTISTFENKLNIYVMKNIPKDVYIISVFSLICLVGKRDKNFDAYLNEIIIHITKRLVMGDYASSPNAKAVDDISKIIVPLISNKEPQYEKFSYPESELIQRVKMSMDELSYSKKTSAIYKLSISILAAERPMNLFTQGMVLVNTTETSKHDVDQHHSIPSKSEMVKKYSVTKERLDKIGNLILISSDENRRVISSRDISDYLKEVEEIQGDDFEKVMESHLIDVTSLKALIKNYEDSANSIGFNQSIEDFWFDRRSKIEKKLLKKFLGISTK